eukprot:scaffold7172_cov119-Alexandrium_tamarense.AAC.14
MRQPSVGNAALVAFVATLLNGENGGVTASSSASPPSSVRTPRSVHHGRSAVMNGRVGPSSSASSSSSDGRHSSAFVQHEVLSGASRRPTAAKGVNFSSSSRRQSPTFVPGSTRGGARGGGGMTTSQKLTKSDRTVVSPRYFLDSSEGLHQQQHHPVENVECISDGESVTTASTADDNNGEEVLIYKDPILDGEFSLLKPYLEFNELDLQELFRKGPPATAAQMGESSSIRQPIGTTVAAVNPSSPSSQLYEEFQEVEIGHFHPNNRSPFFFASMKSSGTATASPFTTTTTNNNNNNEEEEDSTLLPLNQQQPTTLPPWLTLNQSSFAPMKLRKLSRDLTPHLSKLEIQRVTSAIHMASRGDYKKVAGAADFCSILVNTLEMSDVPALCASAFHYCSLVSVRERDLNSIRSSNVEVDEGECSVENQECLDSAGSDAKYLCALAGSGVENYGNHAVKIALDAARLKSMESLATTVVRKNGKLGHLRSGDARNLRSLLLSVNEEGDWRALAIRSAACLYRLEGLEAYKSTSSCSSSSYNPKKARAPTLEESRASQEALHIYAPLAARLGMFRLKTELEDAAFRTLYPHSHAKVSALCGGELTNSVGEGMKSVLSDITNQMKRVVQEDCSFMDHIENVSITARVKEPYSIWRKMLKMSKRGKKSLRDISILDIPDAVALRVVFRARKLTPEESDAATLHREKTMCYYILDLCTRNWPETSDSRFKDYVKQPKDNGYQSLHYSTTKRWRGSEWPFEVQIRSSDMHRVAEYGVAAHWSYKRDGIDDETSMGIATTRLDKTSESYLKSVQEWRSRQAERSYVTPELEEPAQYLEDEIRRGRKRERDERLAPYLEALSGAQTDMTRENVFVFVSVQPPRVEAIGKAIAFTPPSEGTVLSLPKGSRVLDAIRVAEKWSTRLNSDIPRLLRPDGSSATFVALRNGLRTSSMATEQLVNGDVVSILPSSELVSSEEGRGGASRHFFQ